MTLEEVRPHLEHERKQKPESGLFRSYIDRCTIYVGDWSESTIVILLKALTIQEK